MVFISKHNRMSGKKRPFRGIKGETLQSLSEISKENEDHAFLSVGRSFVLYCPD